MSDAPASPAFTSRPRASRLWGAVLIVSLLIGWSAYLRWVSGVLPYTENHPGGTAKAVGFLKRTGWSDYKRHGLWTTYHLNGKKESQGHYDLGRPVGDWSHWDEQGQRVPEPTTTGVMPLFTNEK